MPPSTETASLDPEGFESTTTRTVLGSATFILLIVVNEVALEVVLTVVAVFVEFVRVDVELDA